MKKYFQIYNYSESLPTILGQDQAHWHATAQLWAQDFPDIHTLAREEAQRIVQRHTGQDLDPEQIWWHRFDSAVSSPLTFTGWQHSGRPLQSLTLVQLLLQRYAAPDQDSLDNLQVEGGFYTDGPERGIYDQRNEVRLLAVDVSREFWQIDFAERYRSRLRSFWHEQGRNFVLLARIAFRAAVVAARRRNLLTVADLAVLQVLLQGGATGRVYQWNLGGYLARDALRIETPTGRQILYLPGDVEALQVFDDTSGLYRWLREQGATAKGRDLLLRHFSSFNGARATELQGLRDLLERVRSDASDAWLDSLLPGEPIIQGDPFVWLRGQAEHDMQRQADTLLTSNAHLRQQLWLGYLGAFINLGSAFSPLGWPVALLVVGAAAVSLALNVRKAVYATTDAERRAGILGAINAGIVMAFNTPLLFEARLPTGELAPEEQWLGPAPVAPAIEPLLGGRVNGLGLIERTDLTTLYCVRPLPRNAHPGSVLNAIEPVTRFPHARPMLEGRVLRAFATPSGALEYAKAEFDAAFVMHEIDAGDLPAASFRENFAHNQAALLRHQREPLEDLAEWAGGAWLYDEVPLAMDGLDRGRFLPVSAADIERLAEPLPGFDRSGLLEGVQPLDPGFGRYLPVYSIEVQDVPYRVRYDPFSDTWRTD